MPDLLIELFSEEIPARMQAKAAENLRKRVTDGLVEAGLTYAGARAFATPRRLTLVVSDMLAASAPVREERKGPKADAPEKAIEGFLRSTGLTRAQLETRETPKGDVLFAVMEKPGRPAAEIIAEVLETTIRSFPWPKSMRWGAGSLRWVRPLHRILCILQSEDGTEVVPVEVDGITSADLTEGHRFLAPGAFKVSGFDDYVAKLRRAKVILDPEERADHIWADATNQAFASGLEVVEDKGLLAEVAGLVEWPVVLMGEIGEEFLELPPEVLQTSMKEHQKFFSVRDPKSGKIVRFVTVANNEAADGGAMILAGNRKVLSARLSDAKFFWENDLRVAKSGMQTWRDALGAVTFHNKLGSQEARIARIADLAAELAPQIGADADAARRAAGLAKADLSSEMVYEFPELQGLMGRYYAEAAGHPAEIAAVAEEHYQPLGPSDAVPTAPLSVAVALADKLDTLTGFWAIDEKPTGSKDPFALRRAALGVIRMVLENGLRFDLVNKAGKRAMHRSLYSALCQGEFIVLEDGQEDKREKWEEPIRREVVENPRDQWDVSEEFFALEECTPLFDSARYADQSQTFGNLEEPDRPVLRKPKTSELLLDLLSFFHDRLKVFLRDEGIRHDVIDACLAMPGSDDLLLVVTRARALSEVLKTEDGENLLQGFKRANNILTQAEEADGVEYSYGADPKFAETEEEKALFAALDTAEAAITPALEAEDFAAAMAAMAGLRGPVDAFFEAVQVNAENAILRRNRLNLLSRIRTTCGAVADLTRIEG